MNPIERLFEIYRDAQVDGKHITPCRDDLQPPVLKDVLGWVFVSDWTAPDQMVTRLSGIHIDYVLRRNMTGVNCFDHYRDDEKPVYEAFYRAITGHPCGGYTRRLVQLNNGEIQGYYSIYLPVIGPSRRWQIIGAVVAVFEGRTEPCTDSAAMPDFQPTDTIGVFDIGAGHPNGLPIIHLAHELGEMEKRDAVPIDTTYLGERNYITQPPMRIQA